MLFYVGMYQLADFAHAEKAGQPFERAFVSVNRLRNRRVPFAARDWIMDSGAFTEISTHGHYREDVAEYAAQIRRWRECGNMICAVAQDWMCEPHIVAKTGLSVPQHQRLTVERYDALLDCDSGPVMPVLQGFAPDDYRRHLDAYGARLGLGAYVGVGSVCKRNSNPGAILAVLDAIRRERPDLRLHGFGLKLTALMFSAIRRQLHSADSMAWSFAARREGRDANDWREAKAFEARIASGGNQPMQAELFA